MFNGAEQRVRGAMIAVYKCMGGKQQGGRKLFTLKDSADTKQIGINQPQLRWKLQEDF